MKRCWRPLRSFLSSDWKVWCSVISQTGLFLILWFVKTHKQITFPSIPTEGQQVMLLGEKQNVLKKWRVPLAERSQVFSISKELKSKIGRRKKKDNVTTLFLSGIRFWDYYYYFLMWFTDASPHQPFQLEIILLCLKALTEPDFCTYLYKSHQSCTNYGMNAYQLSLGLGK